MRDTYERQAIADAITDCPEHFDPEQVGEVVRAKGISVSRATVYNTIKLMTKAGLVRCHRFADGKYLYECVNKLSTTNQLHLVCTECGKIRDLRNSAIIKEIGSMKFGTFSPTYVSMTVYGACSRCAKKLRKQAEGATDQLKLFK